MLCVGGNHLTNNPVDIGGLDKIFSSMLHTMDQSKNDIFIISEQSRKSFEDMQEELETVRLDIARLITENDYLENKSRISRRRLAEVSRNFEQFSEEEVKEAYEVANKLLVKLSINETEERQMRQRRDDLEKRLEALLGTIKRADQLVGQVAVVVNYLTSDLKNVGAALESARHKKEFAVRIIEAQEEERKRLSRDIHDGPAQILANVLLRAGLIEQVYAREGPGPAFEELTELKGTVRNALTEVRRIIYDLRPMALDDLGLIPTLKKYLANIEELEKPVIITFQNSGEPQRFNTNIEVAVFRLVQESVTNAIKHGKSKHVWVKVEWLRDIMNISVRDNGNGFDKNAVRNKSFGLIGMRERIDLLKGEMNINSTLGRGTTVLFRIPLTGTIVEN